MPDNAYEMMTAPSRQITSAVSDTIGKLANAYTGYKAEQAGKDAAKQGAAAQFKGLETVSQTTGIPMNPELSEQYKNMGGMSPQQQAVFQNSLGQEAQRMQMLYGINQAQARAGQAQGQMYKQDFQNSLVSAGYTPQMPSGQGGVPAFNPLFNVSPQPTPAQSYWNQSMGGR